MKSDIFFRYSALILLRKLFLFEYVSILKNKNMTEVQMNRLESIIKTWLNDGAQCNSSLKPYTRSLYPTYNPGKRTNKNRNRSLKKSKSNKKSNRSITSSRSTMIQICEDFLRDNRDLLNV
jgi:hypothetical protein